MLLAGLVVVAVLLAALAVAHLRLTRTVRHLERDKPVGAGDLAALRSDLAQALKHVAVVRYDAFGDMGGRLSFSAALLDDAGDGLVLTSINGRTETRTYAKPIVAGQGKQELSPEEAQAVHSARLGTGLSATIPGPTGRRDRTSGRAAVL